MAKSTAPPKSGSAPSKIVMCGCHHSYQDKQYGTGKRLANRCNKGYRCTVCKGLHS